MVDVAPPPVVDAVPNVAATAEAVVQTAAPAAADVTASLPDVGGDLPLVPIAAGAVVVLAAVAALAGGGGGGEEAPAAAPPAPAPVAAAPAPAPEPTVDLSIPYDAAAKLAYEKAGSPGDYQAFKTKYEADAVADVKAKQKK